MPNVAHKHFRMVISGTSVILNSQLQMTFFVILLIALSMWILQHKTLPVNHKGSLTASVKPHACKMYVLIVHPYTSPLDWIYDILGTLD